MKKAFTLIELLVVIAIIAILAAMLMPALNRARLSARVAACSHNIHNLGLGISMMRQQLNENYPRAYYPDAFTNQYCNVWGRLSDGGYVEDQDVFACPVSGSQLQRDDITPDWYTGPEDLNEPGSDVGDYRDVLNAGYGYDNGRIPKTANPARAIAADRLETMWDQDAQPSGGMPQDVAHPDGSANILFVDGAVRGVLPSRPDMVWNVAPYNNVPIDPANPTYLISEIVRVGFVQNPRLDVHHKQDRFAGSGPGTNGSNLDNGGAGNDYDDIYAIDSPTASQLFNLHNNERFERYGATAENAVMDREDAAIQPTRDYDHMTGWTEDQRTVNWTSTETGW